MTQYFSELSLIFSNCTIDGSAWTDVKSSFTKTLRENLLNTTGIEFKGINVNNVSGDHESFTIQVMGAYYKFKEDLEKQEMFDLELILSKIVEAIPQFTCSEVRINHARHRSSFKGLQHPQLAKVV